MSVSFRPIGKTFATGIFAALCISAAAAQATVRESGAEPATATVEKAATGKICITPPASQTTTTGTMLKRRVCKSREQWEAEGVKFAPREAAETSAR